VPQNRQLRFDDLSLKITTTVSSFVPQNQAGFDLLVALQNRRMEDDAGHSSRFDGFLHLEASYDRVSQSGLKTGACETAGCTRGTIVEVTSESS
jgi:hypothetical protein